MATMNISLPQQMRDWVEVQTADGRYANASDYVRDLIRRDQLRIEGIARLQAEIDKGRAGPFAEKTTEDIFREVKEATEAALKRNDAA